MVMSFKYIESSKYLDTFPKFGDVDHLGEINVNNGTGYVPMEKHGFGSGQVENAANTEPHSQPSVEVRTSDVYSTGQSAVVGNSVHTK